MYGELQIDLAAYALENPDVFSCLSIYDVQLDYNTNAQNSIHPATKKPVGERMAEAALRLTYGYEGESMAPVGTQSRIEGESLVVTFENVGNGLKILDYTTDQYEVNNQETPLRGFMICGEDGVMLPAYAEILSKNEVKVWNPNVKNPLGVAYAFAQYSDNANLAANVAEGVDFPALTFNLNVPRKVVYPYFSTDWSGCDIPVLWYFNNDYSAGRNPAWESALMDGCQVELSYDTNNKTYGNASLKVDYVANEEGKFGVSPKISQNMDEKRRLVFLSAFGTLSTFSTLTVDLYNDTTEPITFDGLKIYYSEKKYATAKSDMVLEPGVWTTVTLDLKELLSNRGKNASISSYKIAIQYQFLFTSTTENGTVQIDNIYFG